MSKEKKKKLLGSLRIPVPPPGYPQTTKKGDRGYNRKKDKKELYNILKDEKSYE